MTVTVQPAKQEQQHSSEAVTVTIDANSKQIAASPRAADKNNTAREDQTETSGPLGSKTETITQ